MTEDLPEGWQSFTTALPPKLYAKLQARAESEGVDVLTEAAYLLAYGLDNAPKPSEAIASELNQAAIEPLSEADMELLQEKIQIEVLRVGKEQFLAQHRERANQRGPRSTGDAARDALIAHVNALLLARGIVPGDHVPLDDPNEDTVAEDDDDQETV